MPRTVSFVFVILCACLSAFAQPNVGLEPSLRSAFFLRPVYTGQSVKSEWTEYDWKTAKKLRSVTIETPDAVDSTLSLFSPIDGRYYATSSKSALLLSIDANSKIRRIPTDPDKVLALQKFVSSNGTLLLASRRFDANALELFSYNTKQNAVAPFVTLKKTSTLGGDFVEVERGVVWVSGIVQDRYVVFSLDLARRSSTVVWTASQNVALQVLGKVDGSVLISQFTLSPDNETDVAREGQVLSLSLQGKLQERRTLPHRPRAIATRLVTYGTRTLILTSEGLADAQKQRLVEWKNDGSALTELPVTISFWFSGTPMVSGDELYLMNTFDNSNVFGIRYDLKKLTLRERYKL